MEKKSEKSNQHDNTPKIKEEVLEKRMDTEGPNGKKYLNKFESKTNIVLVYKINSCTPLLHFDEEQLSTGYFCILIVHVLYLC